MLKCFVVRCKATRGRWNTRKTSAGIVREIIPIHDMFTDYEFKVYVHDEIKARSACIREVMKRSNSTMFIIDIQVSELAI
jgi:hypothetical protein